MKRTNVVQMSVVRDLLIELDKLRADVLAGDIQGWGGVVRHSDGRDVIYVGGSFRTSATDRARAMLRVSAALAVKEDNFIAPKKRSGTH
jgi:hypothetical protein